MNTVTMRQMEETKQQYQAAFDGLMRAYGQVHSTSDGKFCWMGRIDRAYTLTAKAEGEGKRKMERGIQQMISLAEKDFVAGEKAFADYKDVCQSLGIEPQPIEPDCQCEYCQRVPSGAELLFAAEGFCVQHI